MADPRPTSGLPPPPGSASPRRKGGWLRTLSVALGAASIVLDGVLLLAFVYMLVNGMTSGYGSPKDAIDTTGICWTALVAATACGLGAIGIDLIHAREVRAGFVLGLVGMVVPVISWINVARFLGAGLVLLGLVGMVVPVMGAILVARYLGR